MNPLYGRDKERFLIGRILGLKVTTKIKVKTRKRKVTGGVLLLKP